MPYTDPVTPLFPAGYAPAPADFTTWVTSPLGFLTDKVMFRGQLQGSEALSGFTLAALDTILEDPYGGWSAAGTGSQGPSSWLCPPGCSGWYEITLSALTGSPGTTTDQVQACLYLDGVLYQQQSASWGVNGHDSGSSAAVQVPLAGGADYVQFWIYSTASVNTPATAGQYPTMEIAWISL